MYKPNLKPDLLAGTRLSGNSSHTSFFTTISIKSKIACSAKAQNPFVRSVLTVSHAVMLLKPGLVEMTVGATCYKYSKGGQNILLQPETADRFMKVTRKSGFKNRGDGDEKNVHHIGLDKPARLTVIWICNR